MSLFFGDLALKVSLLVTLAVLVTSAMQRGASAASRHLVWTLALVGTLVVPIGALLLPSWSVPIHRAAPLEVIRPEPLATSGKPTVEAATGLAPKDRLTNGNADLPSHAVSWGSLALVMYAMGVALLLARLASEQWKTHRLVARATEVGDTGWTGLLLDCALRMASGRPPHLVSSRAHTVPMACGIRKPVIVIPSGAETWDPDRRRVVLLHELAHVARLDCLTQTLAEIATALYWPHPGVWWMAERLRVERELACDDHVISCGTDPRDYAGHLLELAYSLGRSRAPALAVSMAHQQPLEGRLLALLDRTRNRTTPPPGRRLLAWFLALAAAVPLATTTLGVIPVESAGQSSPAPTSPSRGTVTSLLPGPPGSPGTWQLRSSGDGRTVHLTVSERENSFHSATLPIASFDGLGPALLGGGPSRFSLKRDAGTFEFEGILRSGTGGGTVTFAPSATFPGELVKRGFARPTTLQQVVMAASDVGLAFIDELAAQKYARPDLQQLVNAAQHWIGVSYVKELAELGYRLGTVDALIRQHDHGVSPQYIRELRSQGLDRLSADDLVRAHDHGIGAAYVSGLRTLGYANLSVDELIALHDHGISPEYVRDLRALGYQLSLRDLTRAHDHGVGPEYISDLRTLGYTSLSLDDLTRAHDHGVDSKYIKDLAVLAYVNLALDDLVRLHDHGITPEWLRAVKNRSAGPLSVDDLITLHDGGQGRLERVSKNQHWDFRAQWRALLARVR